MLASGSKPCRYPWPAALASRREPTQEGGENQPRGEEWASQRSSLCTLRPHSLRGPSLLLTIAMEKAIGEQELDVEAAFAREVEPWLRAARHAGPP